MKTTDSRHRKARLPPPQDSAAVEARRSFLKLGAAAMAAPLLLRPGMSTAKDGDDDEVALSLITI
ncbi:hypothetical protein [Pseudomonas sp. 2FE]|uniref:hypothetical protein n=1 Tax=Pseudomonas sp. 2FE TaxID=2502190 RepID=UPI0010F5C047|nr:hypothetical protein [Pseudomonas sp. 2FE]